MEEIIKKFKDEFGFLQNKFVIIEESLNNLAGSEKKYIYHPGVYIYHKDQEVIKVGRHLTNSRKRALEHITSNTKNDILEMKDLVNFSATKVTLLNAKDPKDYHWVAAIEIYMENVLFPTIRSKRQ